MNIENLKSEHLKKYGETPRLFRAPGRVNLIGEHTDYNDGFVMPCAIDFATYLTGSIRNDRKICVSSLNFEGDYEFDLDRPDEISDSWIKYIQGIAFTLEKKGNRLKGANLLIESDIPIGSGLSSSAALEIAAGYALTKLSAVEIDKWELAKTGQIAEHEFAGVKSGIMDQFASAFGLEDHALFLDCRSLEWSPIPLSTAQFVICNTKIKHSLVDSEYNKRRADCEEAAKILGYKSLRDISWEEFEEKSAELPERLFRRAKHVISENGRVLEAVKALENNDLHTFGKLMNKSHESLRYDYEVSCDELDLMVEIARKQKGVIGARMTGGGFGGCTVNLLDSDVETDMFTANITEEYKKQTGIEPEIYICKAKQGVMEI